MGKEKKCGSENRQKGFVIGVRVNEVEQAELKISAEAAGLSVPSFIRSKVLAEIQTASRPAPPSIDRKLLSQLLGQLGKVGSNINQIAHKLNEGGSIAAPRITGAIDDFEVLRDEILKALKASNGI